MMRLLKLMIILLSIFFAAVFSFNFFVILSEYLGCKNAAKNATDVTVWGDLNCVGESAEFSFAFFQMICIILAALLPVIIILIIIYREKRKRPT